MTHSLHPPLHNCSTTLPGFVAAPDLVWTHSKSKQHVGRNANIGTLPQMARQQQQQQLAQWRSTRGSRVWTDNEAKLLLNVKLEDKVNKRQENAFWRLHSVVGEWVLKVLQFICRLFRKKHHELKGQTENPTFLYTRKQSFHSKSFEKPKFLLS